MKEQQKNIDRREFITSSTKLAVTASAAGIFSKVKAAPPQKRKLALVGTGSRGIGTWSRSLLRDYGEYVEMVALCDINAKRLQVAKRVIPTDAPVYLAKDFEKMIADTNPDAVIVTTPDCFHADYAIRSMELGCDAISEKPLATTAQQCQDLLDAEQRTGKKLYVTFNARHGNSSETVKKVILSGDLGRIISAEYHEYLNLDHGASYFRRWHGKIRYSGSLLVHKASHHFDQMNWWLDAEPVEVHAFGKVAYYGKNHSFRSKKCRGCPFAEQCHMFWDITKEKYMMDLYVSCENEDGYFRDGCVWDNDIDTYDSMTVEVKYNNDVILVYSLNAFIPYEGQQIAFNGEKGRLDIRNYDRQPWKVEQAADFRLTKSMESSNTWTVQRGRGGHGGADERLKDLLFKSDQPDPLGKLAGSRAGVMSSLIGIAAHKSIQNGKRIKISDMIKIPTGWRS